MKYFATIVFFCGALFILSSAKPPCHMQEVFSCLDIAIGHINSLPRRSLPNTDQDVDALCTAANSTCSCLKDFSKRCMTPIQREIVPLVTEGITNLYDQLCVSIPSKVRTDYLAHAECLNKVTQGEGTNDNVNYLLAVIEHFQTVEHSQRIQYLCCGYRTIYNSVRSDIVNTCSEEAAQSVENLIQVAVAQLPDVICMGIDGDGEECTAILPPPGAKPTEEIKEHPIYKYVFSVFKNYLE